MHNQKIDIGWDIIKVMKLAMDLAHIIVILESNTNFIVSFSSLSPFSIKFYVYNFLISDCLLDEWVFDIISETKDEYIQFSHSNHKDTIKFNESVKIESIIF